jgi:hypothetical protein
MNSHGISKFDDLVAYEFEKAANANMRREARIRFIKWYCSILDNKFVCSTKLIRRITCEKGHVDESVEWTMLNVLCAASDRSVDESLRRLFSPRVLNDAYTVENLPHQVYCYECECMQHVQKKHTMLGNILPEIFVIQLRDCGVRNFNFYESSS